MRHWACADFDAYFQSEKSGIFCRGLTLAAAILLVLFFDIICC
jgi:hypothetical protein